MFSNDYKKETAQEWAQNPLSERFLYFVNYLRPSSNSRASLRYLPTVVAIHMNSYVTSYDPCADAIEWSAAKTKMAEIEHVKRARVGRPNHRTSSATKREKSENDAKCNRSRINIGEEFGRWTVLKTRFGLKTRAEVGTILLDR